MASPQVKISKFCGPSFVNAFQGHDCGTQVHTILLQHHQVRPRLAWEFHATHISHTHSSSSTQDQVLQMANYTGVLSEKKTFIPKAKIFFALSDPRDLANVGSENFLMTVSPVNTIIRYNSSRDSRP